jgi:hypothetical protein
MSRGVSLGSSFESSQFPALCKRTWAAIHRFVAYLFLRRQRKKSSANRRASPLVSSLIAQPLAGGPTDGLGGPFCVGDLAGVVSEIELRQIPM